MSLKRAYEPSETTRRQLVETAEAMFLSDGPEAVSNRAILRAAGQKNISALQYHFGNRAGLIAAIGERRNHQIETRRRQLLEKLPRNKTHLSVRDICEVFLLTPVSLCREDASFAAYLAKFGRQMIALNESLLIVEPITPSYEELAAMLTDKLKDLDPRLVSMRLENANAFVLLAMTRRCESGAAFDGPEAGLFIESLLDQIHGLLTAPVSPATAALLKG